MKLVFQFITAPFIVSEFPHKSEDYSPIHRGIILLDWLTHHHIDGYYYPYDYEEGSIIVKSYTRSSILT